MPLDTERRRSVLAPSRKGKGPSRGPKFIKNPAAKRLAQAVAGILAVAEANEAKPDEFQVGRPNVLDIVDEDTENPLPGSPVGIGANTTVTGIQHIPEQGYSIMSVPSTTITDRLLRREDGSAVPTILPAPVNNPREIDYNTAEGKISVASQLSDEAVLLDAADPTTYQNYNLNGGGPTKGPVWTAFSQSGTPFLVSVDQADSKVRIYNPGGDLNGDGFPDDTTPTELVTLSLGSNALPDGAYYDRSNHVLYVICHNTRELWAFDIDDTSTATLAATQGQVVATFNFDPHDLHVTPDGTQLVVGGDGGSMARGHLSLINIGANAADAAVQVADLDMGPGTALGAYQAIASNSDGELWVTQNPYQRATRIDTSGGGFSLTTEYINFGGYQLGAFTIAQDPPPVDPLDIDNDGDGLTENQGDCDDTDATVSVESEFFFDNDGDGIGPGLLGSGQWFCGSGEATANGYPTATPGDCDDENATVYPGATEQCNGLDEDCDTAVDEDLTFLTYYDDSGDGDGYGDPATITVACSIPSTPGLWITQGGDCSPTDPSINVLMPLYWDGDGDGFGVAGSLPQDMCPDTPGWAPIDSDPVDTDPSIYPDAPELPDGFDNGGNGYIDECLFGPTGTWPTDGLGNPVCEGIELSDGDTVSATATATGALEFSEDGGDRVLSVLGDEAWFSVDKTSPSSLPLAIDVGPGMSLGVAGTRPEGTKYADGEAWVTSVDLGDPAPHPIDATLGTEGNEETITGAIQEGELLVAGWQTGAVNWGETDSEAVSNFYNPGDDDDSGDDDSADDDDIGDDDVGDDDVGDDDVGDDDDATPDDDDGTPDDDDIGDDDTGLDDDDVTPDDDDSANEIPDDCEEGCQASVLTIGPDGELKLNSRALAIAVLGTVVGLRRRRKIQELKRAA